MVRRASPCPDRSAAPRIDPEAERALCVLRHHVELRSALAALALSKSHLEARARASLSARLFVDEDASAPRTQSASAASHRPSVRHVANLFLEEPDAGNLHVRICGGPAPAAGLPDAAPRLERRAVAPAHRSVSAVPSSEGSFQTLWFGEQRAE